MKDYSYGRDRERVEELLKALKALVDRYASLVESGDCGNWDWREEDVIKQAFSAIGGVEDISQKAIKKLKEVSSSDSLLEQLKDKDKRIAELEEAVAILLYDAMTLFEIAPWDDAKDKTSDEYFAKYSDLLSEGGGDEHRHGDNGVEIPRSEGGGEYEHITQEAMEASLQPKETEGGRG